MRIKNIQTAIILFFILLLSVPSAQAGNEETDINNKETGSQVPKYSSRRRTYSGGSGFFGYHQSGYQIISGSATSGLDYGEVAGLKLCYDYQFKQNFSFGFHANVFFKELKLDYDGAYMLAIRGNYHFLDRGRTQKTPLDLYAGISLGNEIAEYGRILDVNEPGEEQRVKLFWGVHVGLRYKIADSWLIFGEIGKKSSGVGIGVMF
jgi:hypothetical protein